MERKRIIFAVAIALTGILLGAESVWTGNAAVGGSSEFPGAATVLRAASNSFPVGTRLLVTNPRNGKSVEVELVSRLESPGVVVLIEQAAAEAIELPIDRVLPVRITPISSPEGSGVGTDAPKAVMTTDPDYNPTAFLGYQPPLVFHSGTPLAAPDRPESAAVVPDPTTVPDQAADPVPESIEPGPALVPADEPPADEKVEITTYVIDELPPELPTEEDNSDSEAVSPAIVSDEIAPAEGQGPSDSGALIVVDPGGAPPAEADESPPVSPSLVADEIARSEGPAETGPGYDIVGDLPADAAEEAVPVAPVMVADEIARPEGPAEAGPSTGIVGDPPADAAEETDPAAPVMVADETAPREHPGDPPAAVGSDDPEAPEIAAGDAEAGSIVYFLTPSDLRPPPTADDPAGAEDKEAEAESMPAVEPKMTAEGQPARADGLQSVSPGDKRPYIQVAAFSDIAILEDSARRLKEIVPGYPLSYAWDTVNAYPVYRLLIGPLRPAERGAVLKAARSTMFPGAFPYTR